MNRIVRQSNSVLILAIALMGSFVSCQQHPVEIFIAPTGNDNASGTRAQPVLTFEKANEIAALLSGKKEVHIILSDGMYYLPSTVVFTPEHSGSEKYPVIVRAANEGKAIISGGDKLHLDWEPYKNGIYKASVSKDVIIDQLYINGDRQRMARFPNAADGKNVFDAWDLVHTGDPDPGNDPLDAERVASWSQPEGAYVHAMHKSLWGDMHWLVTGKNADGSLALEGGWQNNRPSPMHPRYRMVENIFEELDAPGEWYYNKDEKTLYYYPPPGVDLASATIEIVRLKHLIEFRGTKEKPVRFIRLEGLVFRHAARTFMENKEPLLRSDWTIYRGGGVLFDGAEDCTVSDCVFDQLGGNSIFVNNYNRRISIKSCYIHHSGANGIAFAGDPEMVRSPLFRYGKQDFERMERTPGPKGDNYPSDCMVEDCLITMTGRDEKQTAAVQISMSHEITVRHASIYDVPRAGINISEGTFGGHVIEYCDVFNTVLETGDHGSFNSWGRDRFWTPDINETVKEVEKQPDLPTLDMLAPNTIRNSRWRCDHGWDIDLDDGSTWYFIYNNVLLNGGLKMREGYYRTATNNIILNNSLHPHVWYPNSGDIFKHNIVFGAYRPAIMQRGIAPDGQWGAELDSNLFATNHADRMKFSQNGCDEHSLVGNPLFVDAETGDFRVQDQSPALQIGFQNFPMNAFGVVSEKLRKIAKQPEIPKPMLSDTGGPGSVYQLFGASVKNVETPGEQSAAGLEDIRGVVLLHVPEHSALKKQGFQTGDVIVKFEGADIKNFAQLQDATQAIQFKEGMEFGIIRNQLEQNLIWK
ncbi:MAG: PDZ domain-containing protein [Bacteroidales bacterium]|nr:PDZ domain-containing protein [Bacteroidales bacterium]